MNIEEAKKHLKRYEQEKTRPGAFLRAVLTNDLFGALRAADPESRENLKGICDIVWNDLPGDIWGNSGIVEEHLAGGFKAIVVKKLFDVSTEDAEKIYDLAESWGDPDLRGLDYVRAGTVLGFQDQLRDRSEGAGVDAIDQPA